MKIPRHHLTVSNVGFDSNRFRLVAPEEATSEERDIVLLANLELQATEQMISDLRGLDNTSQDRDPRKGKVRILNYQNPALGSKSFSDVSLHGDRLLARAVGRDGVERDCRKVDGSEIAFFSDRGEPGVVPGFSVRTYRNIAPGEMQLVSLSTHYNRDEMVRRMSKEDTLEAVAKLPEAFRIDRTELVSALENSKGKDFHEIHSELFEKSQVLGEKVTSLTRMVPVSAGLLGLASLAALPIHVGFGAGLLVGGLAAGFAALQISNHKYWQFAGPWGDMHLLHTHLAENTREFPPSFIQGLKSPQEDIPPSSSGR